MTSKKMYFILVAVLSLIILAIAGAMYYSREFITSSSDKLVEAKLKLYTLEETESTYRKNQNILNENSDIAEILKSVVPSEKDQARAVRELNIIAADNGLKVTSVIFPKSDLVITKKTTTTGSTTDVKTSAVSQAKAVKNLEGVLGIDVSVDISSPTNTRISTDQILNLLRQIENNLRNMRITSINFSGEGDSFNAKLTLFVKP